MDGYSVKGEKYYGYRYNFDDCVLEYVEKVSDKFDGESDIKDFILEDWEVVTCIGLSSEDWNDNPQYWVDYYMAETDEEAERLVRYI